VLVSPADRGVDVHRASDATARVGSRITERALTAQTREFRQLQIVRNG